MTKIDLTKVTNIVFSGIDHKDYPNYCDAYIVSANCNDKPMTSEEIEELSENTDFVYSQLIKQLY